MYDYFAADMWAFGVFVGALVGSVIVLAAIWISIRTENARIAREIAEARQAHEATKRGMRLAEAKQGAQVRPVSFGGKWSS